MMIINEFQIFRLTRLINVNLCTFPQKLLSQLRKWTHWSLTNISSFPFICPSLPISPSYSSQTSFDQLSVTVDMLSFLEMYLNEFITYVVFCLVSFTRHNFFESNPYFCLYQSTLPFSYLELHSANLSLPLPSLPQAFKQHLHMLLIITKFLITFSLFYVFL
jgi:hypothetical protein